MSCEHAKYGGECESCHLRRIAEGTPEKLRRIGFTGHRISKGNDRDANKRKDRELDRYWSQRAQGMQPDATTTEALEKADQWSDTLQTAYRGDNVSKMLEDNGHIVTGPLALEKDL